MNDIKYIHTCYGDIDSSFFDKLKKIRLIICDIDGTLTDGGIYYDNILVEQKRFDVKDGMGIANLIKKTDTKVAVITARKSDIVKKRMQELGLDEELIIQGVKDKEALFLDLLDKLYLQKSEALMFGDDINDIAIMKHCALSVTPQDGSITLDNFVDYRCKAVAGHGAAREIFDLIMMSKAILSTNGYEFME